MKNFNAIEQIKTPINVTMKYLSFINIHVDLDNLIPGYDIHVNLGLTEDTDNLPSLNLPILVHFPSSSFL